VWRCLRGASRSSPSIPSINALTGSSRGADRTGTLELTLADQAAAANLGTRTLIRGFRAHTGTTPLILVTRQRIHAAQELLETTDIPVEQVGALVGIPAATTFPQRFRTATGLTPSGYRATFRAQA
jgi:transcriptional regulator GlxA family with amidase domain